MVSVEAETATIPRYIFGREPGSCQSRVFDWTTSFHGWTLLPQVRALALTGSILPSQYSALDSETCLEEKRTS
jgi:hypothetical protein